MLKLKPGKNSIVSQICECKPQEDQCNTASTYPHPPHLAGQVFTPTLVTQLDELSTVILYLAWGWRNQYV